MVLKLLLLSVVCVTAANVMHPQGDNAGYRHPPMVGPGMGPGNGHDGPNGQMGGPNWPVGGPNGAPNGHDFPHMSGQGGPGLGPSGGARH